MVVHPPSRLSDVYARETGGPSFEPSNESSTSAVQAPIGTNLENMSKHHRNRNWAPAPQPLPEDAHVIDNHTHVASVVPFSQAMSHEAIEKGQGEVPVYSVDELLNKPRKSASKA